MSDSAKTPTQNRSSSSAAGPDFSLILILFISSRLMVLLAFPPENLIFYGDYQHYFNLSDATRSGYFPFIDYWYEFPPIFPYLNIVIYSLAGQQLKNYIVLLAFVFLLVEAGNLHLIYRLALTLRGPQRAKQVAWIYTALFIPVFFWLGNFDSLTTFFILLGLHSLIKDKNKTLGLALGLGTMVKFIPILLIAPIWRARGLRTALIYVGVVLMTGLMFYGPFALVNPSMTLASLRAQAGKSSYQTVWAMIDGNDTTGNFGPLTDHFDPNKAGQPLHNAARIPTWLTIVPFGLLGLFLLARPEIPGSPNFDIMVFTALTFILFFLWSQGWSPQWQTFLIPLLLLTLPEKRAVLFIVVLGFVNFLEWPIILSRGLNQLLPITILARTAIFVLIVIELYQHYRQPQSVMAPVQGAK